MPKHSAETPWFLLCQNVVGLECVASFSGDVLPVKGCDHCCRQMDFFKAKKHISVCQKAFDNHENLIETASQGNKQKLSH